MKEKKTLYYVSLVYGIIVTFLILIVFVPKLIGEAIEKGIGIVPDILDSFIKFDEDPTAFFFTYIIGYAIVWWKQLPGALIIMLGSLIYFLFNLDVMANLIFSLPAFLVGVLYLVYWYSKR